MVYHAPSYTWGVDTELKEIVVNRQKMRIRKNLEAALRFTRSPTHGVAIWADAICINQSDLNENNLQIPRIARIWEKAAVVICFVGEADEHSDVAMDLVKQLQEPFIRIGTDGQFQVGKPERIAPEELSCRCAALYLFLTRPYFRRAWVLQEIAVASNPLIVCGKRRDINFEQLDSAAYNLQDMLSRDPGLGEQMKQAAPQLPQISANELLFVRKLFYFRHLHMGRARNGSIMIDIKDSAPGYLETAILSCDFQATFPQDKMFSLWNIARDQQELKFDMNYSDSYQKSYIDFARSWALHSGSLDIIGAAEYIVPDDPAAFYATAPSWCPDMRSPARSSYLVRKETFRKFKMSYQDDIDGTIYSADGSMRRAHNDHKYFDFVGKELRCMGIILDTILAAARETRGLPSESKVTGLAPSLAEFCAEHKLAAYEDVLQAVVAITYGDVPICMAQAC